MRIRITVDKIVGSCPVFREGDQIVVDGADLVLEETDAYCVWAAMSFTPYLIAARKQVPADELGLGSDSGPYFVQCLDPGPPTTSGGTVTFRIEPDTDTSI
ncbi:TIGR04076 family protein [Candidatus Thorarchaeota archaeon]|nr:MAG: TIGR04076 family protein [Candidatus Thorarchaeota archaeon]